MQVFEILKAVLFGFVEGITEWLPISSTGHMILLDEFVRLSVSPEFWEVFLVVIQLGAILAVVFLYWGQLFPFSFKGGFRADREKFSMWFKILAASVPAGIVGVFFGDIMDALFYNYLTVAIMLILFGILFIIIESGNQNRRPRVTGIAGITYRDALLIGLFQTIAAVFPGTSRSGATIVGALLIGISRSTAAEFTFFLAIPAMFGGSALKIAKFGLHFSAEELVILLTGILVAFFVSIFAIRFLMGYIKKHDFRAFGWYRIILGALVLAYFFAAGTR